MALSKPPAAETWAPISRVEAVVIYAYTTGMPQTKLGPFVVEFTNSEEFHRLKTEIFTHDCYYVELPSAIPLIIDAGAHIGLTTLYFKKAYPGAQILAIEPHPDTFSLLEKNIYNNNLDGVELLNTALSTSDELVTLHEDTSADKWFSTASLQAKAWNGQQQTQPLTVPSLKLNTLLADIDDTVELLKLDIEGAE